MRSWGETGEGHLNLISVNDKELGGKPTLSEEKNIPKSWFQHAWLELNHGSK